VPFETRPMYTGSSIEGQHSKYFVQPSKEEMVEFKKRIKQAYLRRLEEEED